MKEAMRRNYPDYSEPIRVCYDPKPIPTKRYDWNAVRDGYDAGDPIGFGPTREAAIADLKDEEKFRRG